MRLEDVILRHCPAGGTVRDRRPQHERGTVSFSDTSGLRVLADDSAEPATAVIVPMADLPETSPEGTVTIALQRGTADDAAIPDVLSWAGRYGGQVLDVAAVLSPKSVVCVVGHGGAAVVPTTPGQPGLPADDAAWKRLAGELQFERFRNTLLEENNARLVERLAAADERTADLRRKLKRVREGAEQERTSAASKSAMSRLKRRG